jgi:hypothetical protein
VLRSATPFDTFHSGQTGCCMSYIARYGPDTQCIRPIETPKTTLPTRPNIMPPTSGEPLADERKSFIYSSVQPHAAELTSISTYLSENLELEFEEHKAHELLVTYLEKQGFEVKRSQLRDTSFQASYQHREGGRVYSLNSERCLE